MTDIRIPTVFYRDHEERDLPTPTVIRVMRRQLVIRLEDPHTAELLDDARFYADPYGPSEISIGLRASARATARAIEAAMKQGR